METKRSASALEEDEYISAMSDIIERDFFPNLKKIKVQNEFLDALNREDLVTAKQLERELTKDDEESEDNESAAPKMSLDKFQAKFTSEDNSSFQEIMERNAALKRQQYKWVFDAENKTLLLENASQPLMLEGPTDPKGLIQSWDYKAKNTLMYYPEANRGSLELLNTRAQEKSINHAATRLEDGKATVSSLDVRESTERLRTQEMWKDMAKATPGLFPREGAGATPRVAGYGFVDAAPSPAPHRDVDPSELMTWGTIDGTPLLLDSGSERPTTGGPSFQMAPTPRREELGMRLADRASKDIKQRELAQQRAGTPARSDWSRTPKSVSFKDEASNNMLRRRMLSPAATSLLHRSGFVSSFGSNMISSTPRSSQRPSSTQQKGLPPTPLAPSRKA